MWRYWQIRGHLAEGRERTERVLDLLTPGLPANLRAATMEAAGGLAYWLGDFEAAADRYERQLAVCRESGDPGGIAQALYNLAFPLIFDKVDFTRGEAAAVEAEATFRSLGDRSGVARSLWLLANVANQRHEWSTARSLCLEALPILRELRETFMLGWCLFTVGETFIVEGEDDTALGYLFEALDHFEAAGDLSGLALVLDAVAYVELHSGNPRRAARVSGAVAHLEAVTGTGLNVSNRQVRSFDPLPLRDDPATAEDWAAGARDSTDEILAFVRERRTTSSPMA
jgi:tetratricopeptide (TPR) repeat protein